MMNKSQRIYIFGDSIMKRVLLHDHIDRYSVLKNDNFKTLEETFSLGIINKSQFGCLISKGERIIKNSLNKDLDFHLAVLEFGGNDCDYNWSEVAAAPQSTHSPHTPINEFKKIYQQIINILKQKGIQPIIMSLPPIDAQRYFNRIAQNEMEKRAILQWLQGDLQHIYRFQELYSHIGILVAKENHCPIIDLRSAFLKRKDMHTLFCRDGIHPNLKGHQLILNVCQEFAAHYFTSL